MSDEDGGVFRTWIEGFGTNPKPSLKDLYTHFQKSTPNARRLMVGDIQSAFTRWAGRSGGLVDLAMPALSCSEFKLYLGRGQRKKEVASKKPELLFSLWFAVSDPRLKMHPPGFEVRYSATRTGLKATIRSGSDLPAFFGPRITGEEAPRVVLTA
jgi:hypothetical protein